MTDSQEPRDQTGRELVALERAAKARRAWFFAVTELVDVFAAMGRLESALPHLDAALRAADEAEEKALLLLTSGQACERANLYEAAMGFYTRALSVEPADREVWYLINNNLGYCLNGFGRFGEAEPLCRTAIAVDPERHNAYKNLGLSLQGQGRRAEAAECLLHATVLCPGDPRALAHLLALAEQHPDVGEQVDRFDERLRECEELVRRAG